MKPQKNYKLVINPFLEKEQIIHFDKFTKKKMQLLTSNAYYILFSYNKNLKDYILIDCNFSLNGLEEKLQPYFRV